LKQSSGLVFTVRVGDVLASTRPPKLPIAKGEWATLPAALNSLLVFSHRSFCKITVKATQNDRITKKASRLEGARSDGDKWWT
jgi:hypothetical protein